MQCTNCDRFFADGELVRDEVCLTCMDKMEANALVAEILTRLYGSEVNFTLSGFYDAGLEWEIYGATNNDPGSDGNAATLPEAARAMAETAAIRYPDSELARWWKGRT